MIKKPSMGQRLKSWFGFSAEHPAQLPESKQFGTQEGAPAGPFYGFGPFGGVFPLDALEDGWQRNLSPRIEPWRVSMVNACGMMYARACGQLDAKHCAFRRT